MVPIKYSQNYLKSNSLIRKLVEQTRISKQDYVIEIGAGNGKITDVLARYAKKVTAIEYDAALYEQLIRGHLWNNVKYIHADFLNYTSYTDFKRRILRRFQMLRLSCCILKENVSI